jgi:RNA polymerase sigma-70 factor (ECF subfamily)
VEAINMSTLAEPFRTASQALESTALLIELSRRGDAAAREKLAARCLPVLRRWAHGRLPTWGRDLCETDDLVQISLVRALGALESFAPERPGAFLAYLRQTLQNALRDELRRNQRRPCQQLTTGVLEGNAMRTPPADDTARLAYQAALGVLETRQQHAVVLRIEQGLSFPELAAELGLPSANAARMLVSRALVKLAEAMA